MKNKVYSFAKFYDPNKIQDAVRALVSAGIPRDQIRVLSPTEAAERNDINPPEMKHNALIGALLGALGGLFFGGLIFVLPKFLFEYAYENELAVVGAVIFLGVGISIGVLHSYMFDRRKGGEHVLKKDEHGVFVTVHEGQEEQLNRAKDAYNRMDFANA